MGRGLSDLQKHILKQAYANHISENRIIPRWAVEAFSDGTSDLLRTHYTAHGIPYILYSRNNGTRDEYKEWYEYKAFFDTWEAASEHAGWLKEKGFDSRHTWETKRDLWETRNLRGDRERKERYEEADLHFYEVLAEFFHFSDAPKIHMNGRPCGLRDANGAKNPGDKHFDLEKIGKARYNSAQAALSRALKRLADRRLLFHGTAGGVHLTTNGFVEAGKLTNG